MIDTCPLEYSECRDALCDCNAPVPGAFSSFDGGVKTLLHQGAEFALVSVVPDMLHRVQHVTLGRQIQQDGFYEPYTNCFRMASDRFPANHFRLKIRVSSPDDFINRSTGTVDHQRAHLCLLRLIQEALPVGAFEVRSLAPGTTLPHQHECQNAMEPMFPPR